MRQPPPQRRPKGGVGGVSCGSRTLCMVIYKGLVRSWNGTTWHLRKPQTDFCSSADAAGGT
ncbi:MAG TPA: hypothetical protein VMU94_26825, partial [Streptosporangiaceae bacterium]|nr:hypothetical protein [Streptosporangiaceae bacterium]